MRWLIEGRRRGCPDKTPWSSRTVESAVVIVHWVPVPAGGHLRSRKNAYAESVPAVAAVVIAETNELAGWAGLAEPTFLPEILPAIEVGWRLGEQHRGFGYATEAGTAWIEYGFTVLALEEIVSIYPPVNAASGSVMGRLGFAFDRTTTHPAQGVEVHVMSLKREEWAEASYSRS